MTKVVAIKDMSAGNETIGETWQETAVFDFDDHLIDVFRWAHGDRVRDDDDVTRPIKKRVTITIAEDYQS